MENIFIGKLNLYGLALYFFIYSFLGFLSEVVFHAVKKGKFVNRGFLLGPVCPIYGFGTVAILLILGDNLKKHLLVFAVGVAVPTAIELITGFLLEKCFKNKWWDYSDRPYNLGGYICLEFSLIWGVGVLLIVNVLHPFVNKLISLLPLTVGKVLIIIALVILISDTVLTVLSVLKLNKRLDEIEKLTKTFSVGSKLIGKGVAGVTIAAKKGVELVKQKYDESETKESFVDKLIVEIGVGKEKFLDALDTLIKKIPKRHIKAFPSMKSKEKEESLTLVKERMDGKEDKIKEILDGTSVEDETKEN